MSVPTYSQILDSEVDPESPITQSLLTRLRDNPLAFLNIDTSTVNPIANLGLRGEVELNYASSRVVGSASLTGPTSGVYNLVVPSGVALMHVRAVGAGSRFLVDGASHSYANPGGDTTIVGSTSGLILTCQGGQVSGDPYTTGTFPGGVGPDATGMPGASVSTRGGGGANFTGNCLSVAGQAGYGQGLGGTPIRGGGETGVVYNGGSNLGRSGSGGGGADRLLAVTPGETLQITIGVLNGYAIIRF